jgi:transposase
MNNLPDLSQLTSAQKDELILSLWALVLAHQIQIDELGGRLNLTSQNSSKPPSSDGLLKPAPKSLRKAAQRPRGGQDGHPGSTLCRAEQPDTIITHKAPAQCDACQRNLPAGSVGETRQVFDLPVLKYEVTEHRVMQATCTCGRVHVGEFPPYVRASVQYGPAAQAAMVHLSQHHMMPLQRTASLMGDFFGMPLSQATVVKACADAQERLSPTVQAIATALQSAPVAHADESGLRVASALHWLHVVATQTLTWVGVHAKRGALAFEALGILPQFKGTLIHDGWAPYRALECGHGLCNAHHLRELTYVHEELKQPWAGDMIELLTHASGLPQPVQRHQQGHLRYVYEEILSQAELANPRASPCGKRGRTKQSKATNLIGRLRQHADDVWRFMTEPGVPFTNNVAEQAVRMPKVKQKISGCFRTLQGAETFCVIRSYLATMHKQGANLFESLVQTFQDAPPQPRLA